MRIVVVCFAVAVTLFALTSSASIYEMVGNAYKITLVAAFIPLVCGLYWKRANTQGALFAISAGVSTWLLLEVSMPTDCGRRNWRVVDERAGDAGGIAVAQSCAPALSCLGV